MRLYPRCRLVFIRPSSSDEKRRKGTKRDGKGRKRTKKDEKRRKKTNIWEGAFMMRFGPYIVTTSRPIPFTLAIETPHNWGPYTVPCLTMFWQTISSVSPTGVCMIILASSYIFFIMTASLIFVPCIHSSMIASSNHILSKHFSASA